jgi:N-acetylglucosaminyldiphosphoundecaprenol N-acetyl-beta-D-mannosaminyltransferase
MHKTIITKTKHIINARWADELHVPVCHGVGGSFDVLAGKVRRAPRAWQRMGLEWLYRVWQEPGRLWKRYLVTNSAFVWIVLWEFMVGPRHSESVGPQGDEAA